MPVTRVQSGWTPAEESTAQTTVLIVEDDASVQETLAYHLKDYRRYAAYNGQQAKQFLAKHHVDVIILDLNLPDTTGGELLREIRSERDDLEVIVVTSHTGYKNAVDLMKAGAFDFLAKDWETYERIHDHV